MRINKYLARCGLGSRREVEKIIVSNKIEVNGEIITDLSFQINETKDIVEFHKYQNQKPLKLKPKEFSYYIFNKPRGYLVTKKDKFDRKTIYGILPKKVQKLNYIGRLDLDSSGLLLLTNDGDFANELLHPKYHIPKTYIVNVNKKLNAQEINHFKNGIKVDDYFTLPAKIEFLKNQKGNNFSYKVIIYEGKKRQIRRMFEFFKSKVLQLNRTEYGGVKLGNLKVGAFRVITENELRAMKKNTENLA